MRLPNLTLGGRRARQAEAMPIASHLAELRRRLTWSVIAVSAASVGAWWQYTKLFATLTQPLEFAVAEQAASQVTLALSGVAEPFTLQIQVCGVAGLILASPICLFHVWRFVSPGLHRRERRMVWWFLGCAIPLSLLGVWLGYRLLPQALHILIGFTPDGVANIIPVGTYVSFLIRMLLVFGLAFQLPVFIVTLNSAGIVTAAALRGWWRQIVIAILVFAAVATPTGDPVNMLALALPMMAIAAVAVVVCAVNDRRRLRRASRVEEHSQSAA